MNLPTFETNLAPPPRERRRRLARRREFDRSFCCSAVELGDEHIVDPTAYRQVTTCGFFLDRSIKSRRAKGSAINNQPSMVLKEVAQ